MDQQHDLLSSSDLYAETHSFRHSFWHTIWKYIWPFFWHSIWHSIWHLSWQSFWHLFWQSIWHSVWHFAISHWFLRFGHNLQGSLKAEIQICAFCAGLCAVFAGFCALFACMCRSWKYQFAMGKLWREKSSSKFALKFLKFSAAAAEQRVALPLRKLGGGMAPQLAVTKSRDRFWVTTPRWGTETPYLVDVPMGNMIHKHCGHDCATLHHFCPFCPFCLVWQFLGRFAEKRVTKQKVLNIWECGRSRYKYIYIYNNHEK